MPNKEFPIKIKMTLENKFKRRDFLKLAGTAAGGAVIGSLPIIGSACKGSTTPEPTPHDVTINITFYNHTQGLLGEKTYKGKSGSDLAVQVGLLGYDGVDNSRIALRKATGTELMGQSIGFSNTGKISVKYPDNDQAWDAYLMNTAGGTNYDYFNHFENVMNFGASLWDPRDTTWSREDVDGATGPEEPISEAFRQLSEALAYPWKKYGSFTKSENGTVKAGYGYNFPYGGAYGLGASSWSTYQSYVRVHPDLCPTHVDKLKMFIDMIFCRQTVTTGLYDVPLYNTICDPASGNLNSVGRDFLAYVYVKNIDF